MFIRENLLTSYELVCEWNLNPNYMDSRVIYLDHTLSLYLGSCSSPFIP